MTGIGYRIVFSEDAIERRVEMLAGQIAAYYSSTRVRQILAVPILNGASKFACDLTEKISSMYPGRLDVTVDPLHLSSYGAHQESQGEPELLADLQVCPERRHILLIEDIVETGRTLDFAYRHMQGYRPSSIRSAVLINKVNNRLPQHQNLRLDHVGFETDDPGFLEGYGMNNEDGTGRGSPFIGVRLTPAIEYGSDRENAKTSAQHKRELIRILTNMLNSPSQHQS